MRPARCSTFRCFVTAGGVILKGSDNSVTVASPVDKRARMARRVGSARAANVALRGSVCICIYPCGKLKLMLFILSSFSCCSTQLAPRGNECTNKLERRWSALRRQIGLAVRLQWVDNCRSRVRIAVICSAIYRSIADVSALGSRTYYATGCPA